MRNLMSWSRPRRRRQRRKRRRSLRFSPHAWAKLLFLRDRGPTEIGGFGISSEEDPLLVTDIAVPRQNGSYAGVEFEDDAVADLFDEQVDLGRRPDQFARIWVHTHPGDSPCPSGVDEETFRRVFGACDWAVMFILARGGATYARLRFRAGPGGQIQLRTKVEYSQSFVGSDIEAWDAEYLSAVQMPSALPLEGEAATGDPAFQFPDFEAELLGAMSDGNYFL
jgi:hypothetical protein